MLVELLAIALTQGNGVIVTLNEQPVQFNNAQPVQVNGRVLVPLRGIFEGIGASVKWVPQTRTVLALFDENEVQLQIGSKAATVNQQVVNLDVPAQIINGSTMVPLRFVGESMG